MVIHELATNAAKYGALSAQSGRIDLQWSVGKSGDADRLRLTWVETNRPPVNEPIRRGSGTD
jgi:two-component system, chemotaxis family, CheB/CheR fusion protein